MAEAKVVEEVVKPATKKVKKEEVSSGVKSTGVKSGGVK
jgi:hypothetical protein